MYTLSKQCCICKTLNKAAQLYEQKDHGWVNLILTWWNTFFHVKLKLQTLSAISCLTGLKENKQNK